MDGSSSSQARLDLGGSTSGGPPVPPSDLVSRAQAYGVDGCAGVRRVYARFFALMTANPFVACFLMGIPSLYLFGFAVAMTQNVLAFNADNFAAPTWVLDFVFVACWTLAILCVVFAMPNVIALPLFIMRVLSHWALVSFILLLLYPSYYSGFGALLGLLAGLIITMLFSADVMRAEQEKLLAAIRATQQAAEEAIQYRDAAIKARASGAGSGGGASAPGAGSHHPLEAMSTEEHA